MHARAGHFAVGDRRLYIHVRVHGAFRLQVANSREAVRKRDVRVARGENRAVGNRLLQQLRVVFLGRDVALQQNVRMGIDESGQYRGFGKVNHFHTGRRAPADGNGGDPVAFNDDQSIFEGLLALPID